jgi:Rv0078B-related antitoxin
MIHTNTPDHIRKIQNQILRERSPEERGQMAIEMFEMGRLAVKNRLRQQNPTLSEAELKGEIFKCFYRDKFDAVKMAKIVAHLVNWHELNPGIDW